jgi:hypothetical protein
MKQKIKDQQHIIEQIKKRMQNKFNEYCDDKITQEKL